MRTLLLLLATLAAVPASAQHDHSHAASGSADVPTGLTAEEVAGLLDGSGMGLARPAELHSYAGPLHVLELADDLALTDHQRAAAESARASMLAHATALGARIVEMERHLDALFASGEATVEQVAQVTTHIAKARAELRTTHLVAHLAMREVLTEEQVATYDRLRGYTD